MKRLVCALTASLGLFFPAPAGATPGQCWQSPFGGFCDSSPYTDGSFQHCETVVYPFGTSSYRNCWQACMDNSGRMIPTDYDFNTPC